MADLPDIPEGFVRIAVLLTQGAQPTPGMVASSTGQNAEDLGAIWVDEQQVLIDVRAEIGPDVREKLEQFGPTQLQKRQVKVLEWKWLRLAIGRNHGFTLSHLKRLMERADGGPLGKIHLNNTYTTVGVREDHWDRALAYFTDHKVNGKAVKPGPPGPGEVRGSAQFIPNKGPI